MYLHNILVSNCLDELSPTTSLNTKWSTSTIVITAVISSFIAVVMVLLLIFIAMVARHKLLVTGGRRKSPAESQEGTLPYDNQTDFGYVSPDEIRKCKITTTGEYTEPFSTSGPPIGRGSLPPLITFPGSNLHSMQGSGAGDAGSGPGGQGGKMAEYYSCTLISNPVPPNNSGNYSLHLSLTKISSSEISLLLIKHQIM